jgi:hypothetical protein
VQQAALSRPSVKLIQRRGKTEVDHTGARVLRGLEQLEAVLKEAHQRQTITFLGTSHLEDATFAEQVCTFAEVSILVGVHGQALSNMLWMETGSVVVELMHTAEWWYSDLARAKGVHFIGLPGNPPAVSEFQSAIDSAVSTWRARGGAGAHYIPHAEL